MESVRSFYQTFNIPFVYPKGRRCSINFDVEEKFHVSAWSKEWRIVDSRKLHPPDGFNVFFQGEQDGKMDLLVPHYSIFTYRVPAGLKLWLYQADALSAIRDKNPFYGGKNLFKGDERDIGNG